MTWGKSKLMALMLGYLETIMLVIVPIPPPTSTIDPRPSKPEYVSRTLFIMILE